MEAATSEEDAADGFAERLKRLVEESRYSHRELADELGVSKQSVTNWTQGHAEPKLSNLRGIARALGISLARLLEEAEDFEPVDDALARDLLRELASHPFAPAARSLATTAPDLLDLLSRAERYVESLDRQRDQAGA